MNVQKQNPQRDDLLSARFQERFDMGFSWQKAVSMYTLLPGLRICWPMSGFGGVGPAADISGQTRSSGYVSPWAYGFSGLIPYGDTGGTGYLFRNDESALDITGTETFVESASQGLTMGCWMYQNSLGATYEAIMGKWDITGNQRSYLLSLWTPPAQAYRFDISNAGAASDAVATSTVTPVANEWRFFVGRFVPSTSADIYVGVNGDITPTKDSDTVGVPASIFNSSTAYRVGSYIGGSQRYIDAKFSLTFLCAVALSDVMINMLFQHTKPLFGLR